MLRNDDCKPLMPSFKFPAASRSNLLPYEKHTYDQALAVILFTHAKRFGRARKILSQLYQNSDYSFYNCVYFKNHFLEELMYACDCQRSSIMVHIFPALSFSRRRESSIYRTKSKSG